MCRLHTPVNPYMLHDIPTVVTPHEVEPMLRRALCGLLAVMLLVIAAASVAYVPDVLKISAIPDENPNELMRIYTPFAEYLGRELGIKEDAAMARTIVFRCPIHGTVCYGDGSVEQTRGGWPARSR